MRLLLHISRLHITAIAALGMLTFGWLFTGRYLWFLAVVCALDWHIVNLFNKIADVEEDRANAITGTTFVLRHARELLYVTVAVLILSIVIVHRINPAITAIRLFVHVLGIAYNWPLPPGKKRLKELYFWKNTASAIGFLATVFGYPLAAALHSDPLFDFPSGISWMTVLFAGMFFFLFEMSYEIVYDLRDIQGDRLAGMKTYPVVHGESGAVRIIDALLCVSVVTLCAGYLLRVVPWRLCIMTGAPVLQLIVYKRALRRGIASGDCIMMTWLGVLMFVVYHLWVLADLPGAQA